MNALVYDIEIVKGIVGRNESPLADIQYCKGWNDHDGMGISVIGCIDLADNRPRVFCKDNFSDFAKLCEQRDLLIGFNSIPFDNAVLRANGIDLPEAKCYDLLREIWAAAGLGPVFQYPSHAGFGLDEVCKANFGHGKTGHGAVAPVQWQRGEVGSVIDYCLADVWLTEKIFARSRVGPIKCPVSGGNLNLRWQACGLKGLGCCAERAKAIQG